MDTTKLTIYYGGAMHLAGIAAMATLVGIGAVSPAEGLPILGGLLGIGVGAGVALIVPGGSTVPSGSLGQPQSAGIVAPAPQPIQAPPAPVQSVAPLDGTAAAPVAPQPA